MRVLTACESVSQCNRAVSQVQQVCPHDTTERTEAITPVVRASTGASEWLAKDAEVIGRLCHLLHSRSMLVMLLRSSQ